MKEIVKVNIIKSAYGVVEEDVLELVFDDDSKGYILISEIKNIDISKKLQQENQELKKQLEYLRSGEYYNQLRFENEMLQQVVDTNGVPSEVYDYIDCTHRNTELLEKQKEFIEYLEKTIIDSKAGSGQQYYYQQVLEMYKEIIGGKE